VARKFATARIKKYEMCDMNEYIVYVFL